MRILTQQRIQAVAEKSSNFPNWMHFSCFCSDSDKSHCYCGGSSPSAPAGVASICPLRVSSPLLLSARRINTLLTPVRVSLLTPAALLNVFYVAGSVQQHLHVPHEGADPVHGGTLGVENRRGVGHLAQTLLRLLLLRLDLLGFQLAVLSRALHHYYYYYD